MSSISGLRQTYPPLEPQPVAYSHHGSASAVSAMARSSNGTDSRYSGEDKAAAMSDEDRSAVLSDALRRAGFVPSKVRTHFVFADTLDAMWRNFGFTFAGNFTEGWGYNLFAVNGRPGFDSSVAYKYVHPGHTVHFEDCQCPDRGQLTCHISKESGALQLSRAAIPIIKEMGLVVNIDGEVLNPKKPFETRKKMVLSRCSANPEVHFTEQLRCCPHFTRRVMQSLKLPASWCRHLEGQSVTLKPRIFGTSSLDRTNLPEANPDFSSLERVLFQGLSEEHGHLYMLLKYILLQGLPRLLPGGARPFSELHCRQLFWYLMSEPGQEMQQQQQPLLPSHLIGRARRGLQLLSELVSRQQRGNRSTAMRNFFDVRLAVQFLHTNPEVERTTICRLLQGGKRLLSEQVDKYIAQLGAVAAATAAATIGSASGGGTGADYFVFRPLLMTIPGCCVSAVGSRGFASTPVASLNDYPSVGFRLYRALDILLEEGPPSPAAEAELAAIVASLRCCATTAAACLRALAALKTGQGAGLAQQALTEGGGQISVTDCFQTNNLTGRMVESALIKTDCAWIYRCKLVKDEHEVHSTACHSPLGTQFLASYPLIRSLFFPARQQSILHTERCCFEYRLRINFVALWHSLRSQLGKDWGSCVTTSGLLPATDVPSQDLIEAQELVAQALVCSSQALTRRRLLVTFRALLSSSAPFHLDRNCDEWRWLQLIRLHLMGAWLDELTQPRPDGGGWSPEQKKSCCELVDWCNQYEDLFHCLATGCGVSAMLHSSGAAVEMQARSMLRSLLDTEMEYAFPLTPESGYLHDLLVMQLYASHWSDRKDKAGFQRRAKLLASH